MGQIDPLLPFTISSGTGGEHQKAGVGATGRMRHDRPFLKQAANASDRPGAQHSSQAIERRKSTSSGRSL